MGLYQQLSHFLPFLLGYPAACSHTSSTVTKSLSSTPLAGQMQWHNSYAAMLILLTHGHGPKHVAMMLFVTTFDTFWKPFLASKWCNLCTFCVQKVCNFFQYPDLTSFFFTLKDMINSLRTNIILSAQLCSMAWLITDMLKNPMEKREKIQSNIVVIATNAHLDLATFLWKFNGNMYNLRTIIQ